MRAQPADYPDWDSDPSIVEAAEGYLDQTPPPDHEGWLEARESGLRWTRKRWELRRRMKLEREQRCGGEVIDQTPPPDHEEF